MVGCNIGAAILSSPLPPFLFFAVAGARGEAKRRLSRARSGTGFFREITSGMKKRRTVRTVSHREGEYIFFHFRGSAEGSRMLRNLGSRAGFTLRLREE